MVRVCLVNTPFHGALSARYPNHPLRIQVFLNVKVLLLRGLTRLGQYFYAINIFNYIFPELTMRVGPAASKQQRRLFRGSKWML